MSTISIHARAVRATDKATLDGDSNRFGRRELDTSDSRLPFTLCLNYQVENSLESLPLHVTNLLWIGQFVPRSIVHR